MAHCARGVRVAKLEPGTADFSPDRTLFPGCHFNPSRRVSFRRGGGTHAMPALFALMTEAVFNHWNANGDAYPEKFLLTPAQHRSYVASRQSGIGGPNLGAHMGVPVEISSDTVGVVITAGGLAISLKRQDGT